jgi:hypothetical protein
MGWKKLSPDETPSWIKQKINQMPKGHTADCPPIEREFYGDTFVYRIVMNEGDNTGKVGVYRQLKSDYFTTTSKEGTCPNCQAYVRRMDGDECLTCHRCGWQYKPLSARIKNSLPL